jgi:hypothetical protein
MRLGCGCARAPSQSTGAATKAAATARRGRRWGEWVEVGAAMGGGSRRPPPEFRPRTAIFSRYQRTRTPTAPWIEDFTRVSPPVPKTLPSSPYTLTVLLSVSVAPAASSTDV